MTIDYHQLVALQRAEFEKAATLYLRVLAAQAGIAACAAIAVFVEAPTYTYLFGLGAAALTVFWFWLDQAYSTSRTQAERARRATLLIGGLGEDVSINEIRDIEAHFTVPHAVAQVDEDYYAAQEEPGDKRLAAMLNESAFWTCHLMRWSAEQTWLVVGVVVAVALVMVFGSAPFVTSQTLLNMIRVFSILVLLVISKEMIGRALSYRKAAEKIGRMLPRLDAIRAAGYPRADLLMLLSDYNSAVQEAPLVAPFVYEQKRERLNEMWKRRTRSGAN